MKRSYVRQAVVMGFAGIMGMGGVAGCASSRVHTSLTISGEPVPRPNDAVYRIAAVQFLTPTNVTGATDCDFGEYKIKESDLQTKLMDTACAAYPKVFSTNAAAVPLEVCITRTAHEGIIGADACVSCLTLTIVPLRTGNKTSYTVRIKFPGEQPAPALVEFAREDIGWLSWLPTGLLPVPGGKGQRATGMEGETKLTQQLMLRSCVEAIAVALRRPGNTAPRN